jgi:hypothetical protein
MLRIAMFELNWHTVNQRVMLLQINAWEEFYGGKL